MTKRINYFTTAPQAMDILLAQEEYLNKQFVDKMALLELVRLRVAQINQCAYCIDMHSKEAIKLGENAERIFGLNAWRDMPFYSLEERSALQWAETICAAEAVSDHQYQQAIDIHGAQQLVDLTIAVNAINSWTKLTKSFKPKVGTYQPN